MTSAATQTNLLFSDSDTLDAGYFVRYRDSITHSGSTVRVELSVNGIVDFCVCTAGAFEAWNDGGSEPY